jgi:hypothetical protein
MVPIAMGFEKHLPRQIGRGLAIARDASAPSGDTALVPLEDLPEKFVMRGSDP